MHLYEKRKGPWKRAIWLGIVVFIGMLAAFMLLLSSVASKNLAREEAMVENAIRRAMVTCYVIEGRYPEDFSYLCENYGVIMNKSRYIVRYEFFASNVMPSVGVLSRGGAS